MFLNPKESQLFTYSPSKYFFLQVLSLLFHESFILVLVVSCGLLRDDLANGALDQYLQLDIAILTGCHWTCLITNSSIEFN